MWVNKIFRKRKVLCFHLYALINDIEFSVYASPNNVLLARLAFLQNEQLHSVSCMVNIFDHVARYVARPQSGISQLEVALRLTMITDQFRPVDSGRQTAYSQLLDRNGTRSGRRRSCTKAPKRLPWIDRSASARWKSLCCRCIGQHSSCDIDTSKFLSSCRRCSHSGYYTCRERCHSSRPRTRIRRPERWRNVYCLARSSWNRNSRNSLYSLSAMEVCIRQGFGFARCPDTHESNRRINSDGEQNEQRQEFREHFLRQFSLQQSENPLREYSALYANSDRRLELRCMTFEIFKSRRRNNGGKTHTITFIMYNNSLFLHFCVVFIHTAVSNCIRIFAALHWEVRKWKSICRAT